MFHNEINGTESICQQVMAVGGTLSNFYVRISQVAGVGSSYAFTVRQNGTNTSVTCTISGNASTSCSDLTNSVTFAAGDLITVLVTPSNNPANATMRWTARYQ